MGLVQYPFFILLIALQPVMNQPEIVPTFKYHSVRIAKFLNKIKSPSVGLKNKKP